MSQLQYTIDVVDAWTKLRPGRDLASLSILQRLLWAGRLTESIIARVATASGLRNRGDYEILALIRRTEPDLLTLVEIADRLRTSPSGMTGKIDRLEGQGFIQRRSYARDRRVLLVALTDLGRSTIEEAFDVSTALYDRLLVDLSDQEKGTLDDLLAKVVSTLDLMADQRQPWK